MAMKGYFTFTKALILDPHHQIVMFHIRILILERKGSYLQHRCSQYTLQHLWNNNGHWSLVCVSWWVTKEGILSSASLTSVKLSRGSPLSISTRRLHKELCPPERAKPERAAKKDKRRWWIRNETSAVESQTFKTRTWGWSVDFET